MDAKSSQVVTAPVIKKRKVRANATAGPSTCCAEGPKGVPAWRGRRKIGMLASLPSMPLDILFEILGHLKPYDVLRLARTTKDFRRLLLSRSSLSIWKAALSNIPGLPDCPPGMSEPAWTNLVFSPHCNFCLTTSVRKVQWILRIRICSKCAKEHLAESRLGFYEYEGICSMEHLIPATPGKKEARIYLKSDRMLFEAQYAALEKAEARLFVEERRKAVIAIAQHAKLCGIWARSQTLDRDQQLQQLREDRLAAITQKLEDLGWAEDIAGITMPDSLANHKLVDRPQLLTERIWTNIKPGILKFMAEMHEKREKREFAALVNQRKRSAVAVLRTFKNARLPETEIMPQGPDFCHLLNISELLNLPADVEVNVSTFDYIIPLLPDLVTEWRESIKRKMIQVIKVQKSIRRSRGFGSYLDFIYDMGGYTDGYTNEAPPVSPNLHLTDEELSQKLILASTVFTCDCGGGYDDYRNYYDSDDNEDDWPASEILFYPQVMGHNCLTRVSNMLPWEFSSTNDPSCRLESSWTCNSERKQWDSSGLSLHSSASKIARHIIQLAGLNPDQATSRQLDQLKIRFGCRTCVLKASSRSNKYGDSLDVDNDDDDPAYPVFDWRGAISHQTNKHPNADIDVTFVKISEDDFTEDIEEAENEHWAKVDFIWSCTHCRDLPTEAKVDTFDGVRKHISKMHQIESPVLNQDYFQDYAASDMRNYGLSPFYVRYNGNRFSLTSGRLNPASTFF